MGKTLLDIVRDALRGAGVHEAEQLTSERDFHSWLAERKRFRDINVAKLEEVRRELQAVGRVEQEAIEKLKGTQEGSIMEEECLTAIDHCQQQATRIRQVRAIRQKNVEINECLITEIEKAIATTDLGMEVEQMDVMAMKLQDGIRDWAQAVSTPITVESVEDTQRDQRLDDLRRRYRQSVVSTGTARSRAETRQAT